MNGVQSFLGEQKRSCFFPARQKKIKAVVLNDWMTNELFPEKKNLVTLACDWKFRRKITRLSRALVVLSLARMTYCHGLFCKFPEICHDHFSFSTGFFFCDGQNTHFHWQNFGFFVTGTFKKLKSTFSRSITGTENCHGKRKKQTLLSLTRIKRLWWRNRNTTVLSLFSY